jgi:hypothetical protein
MRDRDRKRYIKRRAKLEYVCEEVKRKGVNWVRISTLSSADNAFGIGMVVVVVVRPALLLVIFILTCSLDIIYEPMVELILGT